MKTNHAGDCAIHSPLQNGMPKAGICTCGYGLEYLREGNHSEMYSDELKKKLEEKSRLVKKIEAEK